MTRSQIRLDRRRHFAPSRIAHLLDVETFTVLSWIRKGQLPAMNIGTGKVPHYQVFRADLIAFMLQRGCSEAHVTAITGTTLPSPNPTSVRSSSVA